MQMVYFDKMLWYNYDKNIEISFWYEGFMKTDFFEFSSEYKLLSAVLWLPEIEPKAVLQITHGMTEHIGRYEEFAEQMTAIGIAVCGFDLRGHGKNGNDEDYQ